MDALRLLQSLGWEIPQVDPHAGSRFDDVVLGLVVSEFRRLERDLAEYHRRHQTLNLGGGRMYVRAEVSRRDPDLAARIAKAYGR